MSQIFDPIGVHSQRRFANQPRHDHSSRLKRSNVFPSTTVKSAGVVKSRPASARLRHHALGDRDHLRGNSGCSEESPAQQESERELAGDHRALRAPGDLFGEQQLLFDSSPQAGQEGQRSSPSMT